MGLAIRDFLLINQRRFFTVEHKLEIFFSLFLSTSLGKRLSSSLKVAAVCETWEYLNYCYKYQLAKEQKYRKPLIMTEDRQSRATHWDDSRRLKVVLTASAKMIEADHIFEAAQ